MATSSNIHWQRGVNVHEQVYVGNGQLVLIVEDHAEVAHLMATMMQKVGYTTQICRDVLSAIRVFNQKEPSAVVLDLMLPDMYGLEFCRYVRRDAQKGATPVVVVSAAKTNETIASAMQAGADAFIGKPVSVKELQQAVSSLIYEREHNKSSVDTKSLVGTAPLDNIEIKARQDTVVAFVAGHSDTPITVTVKQTVSFGRGASSLPGRPHIDLTRFNAMERGVSRTHMYISRREDGFYIEDAASVNGTFVNGEQLNAHEARKLNNADEVRLGQLRVYIYFLTEREKGEETGPLT